MPLPPGCIMSTGAFSSAFDAAAFNAQGMRCGPFFAPVIDAAGPGAVAAAAIDNARATATNTNAEAAQVKGEVDD